MRKGRQNVRNYGLNLTVIPVALPAPVVPVPRAVEDIPFVEAVVGIQIAAGCRGRGRQRDRIAGLLRNLGLAQHFREDLDLVDQPLRAIRQRLFGFAAAVQTYWASISLRDFYLEVFLLRAGARLSNHDRGVPHQQLALVVGRMRLVHAVQQELQARTIIHHRHVVPSVNFGLDICGIEMRFVRTWRRRTTRGKEDGRLTDVIPNHLVRTRDDSAAEHLPAHLPPHPNLPVRATKSEILEGYSQIEMAIDRAANQAPLLP